jgi:lipid-A-disaccharide synthase
MIAAPHESAHMASVPTIFISAGEASGEHYGALLVSALERQLAARGLRAEFIGMGGDRMAAAGLQPIVRSEDMAVMGLTEVLLHLPRIYREFRRLKQAIRARRPAVAILIDFPEIHFRLAREFHRLGIPVIYFVSPQLWAWKQHRIELVRKYVSRMLVIFPFEQAFYRERSIPAEFVGHPLAELPPPSVSREDFAREHGLLTSRPWIGLLPGSRLHEIEGNLPEMLTAARLLAANQNAGPGAVPQAGAASQLEFILPLAPTLTAAQRTAVQSLAARHGSGLSIHFARDARAVLHHARASIVASGTATVEAALAGNPFVVVYRVSPLTYAIARRVVKVPHVAMANLIAGRRLVPELIQGDFTAANIVQQISPLLPDGTARQSMMQGLLEVRQALTAHLPGGSGQDQGATDSGAIDRVAAITLAQIDQAQIGPQ